MENVNIIIVEEEEDVLKHISKELDCLKDVLFLEECTSVSEADEVIRSIDENGDLVAIIISDNCQDKQSGATFLEHVHQYEHFRSTKKILLTNNKPSIPADTAIDRYVDKNLRYGELLETVKYYLSKYILEKEIAYKKFLRLLDEKMMSECLHKYRI